MRSCLTSFARARFVALVAGAAMFTQVDAQDALAYVPPPDPAPRIVPDEYSSEEEYRPAGDEEGRDNERGAAIDRETTLVFRVRSLIAAVLDQAR